MSWLIGKTGYSLLDGWTLVHVAFWLVAGANAAAFQLKHSWALAVGFVLSLLFSLLWEVLETLLQTHTNWIAHHESWMNRWVSDPFIAMPVGYFLGVLIIKYLAR